MALGAPPAGGGRRDRRRQLRCHRAARRGPLDRRARPAAAARGARPLRRLRRGAAGSRGRAEVGHHRPRRSAPRAGPAGTAQGPGPVRQPASGAGEPRAGRRQSAARGAGARRRHDHRARADGRHLLRRPWPARRRRARHLRLLEGRDREDRPACIRDRVLAVAAGQGHVGRQGQHPRDVASLARDGRAGRRPATATSRSSTCWSTTPPCS